MADAMDQPKSTIADHNPVYVHEYEHAMNRIWDLNHSGIKLNLLDKMKVLGYIKDKIREKDSVARAKWEKGDQDPDPYDEAAVHCAAVCQYLDKCARLMEECRSADAAFEYEQYQYRQEVGSPPSVTNDTAKEAHLAEIKVTFKIAKKKFVDALNPKKSLELSQLVDQLK